MATLARCRFPILLALFALAGCSDDLAPVVEHTPRVKYFTVGEQATGQTRRISGKLVAADSSPLSFGVGGTVAEVLVAQGDEVQQGQVLARLDTEPLELAVEQARAELNIARAKAAETRQAYKRVAELFKKRAASQAEVDSATANHGVSRGNVRSAKSALARGERDLAHAELAAPFAGIIASRSVEPFQEISAGSEAFVLETGNALEVEVRVPETLIRNVDFGQAVQVTFPTLDDTTVSGTVNEIGSRAESGNAFPVSIQLSSTDADLRPGMTAGVTFNFDAYLEGKTVFLIPLSALAIEFGMIRETNEADSGKGPRQTVPLFVINDANQLEARDVVVGDLRGNQLEVFEGLAEGEKIVSAAVSFLREGMTVELWTPDQGFTSG